MILSPVQFLKGKVVTISLCNTVIGTSDYMQILMVQKDLWERLSVPDQNNETRYLPDQWQCELKGMSQFVDVNYVTSFQWLSVEISP